MVERSLSMREALGSMPSFSIFAVGTRLVHPHPHTLEHTNCAICWLRRTMAGVSHCISDARCFALPQGNALLHPNTNAVPHLLGAIAIGGGRAGLGRARAYVYGIRHVQAMQQSKMSAPGVEPGLSRPQRDVLTTRRCGLDVMPWRCSS